MKEGEKPGKFLLPHGIILLEFGPYRIFMEGNPEGIQNQRPLGIMELSVSASRLSSAIITTSLPYDAIFNFTLTAPLLFFPVVALASSPLFSRCSEPRYAF